jgi:hypothetical protein
MKTWRGGNLPGRWDCQGNVTLVSWGVRIVFSTAGYKAPCRPKLKEFSTPFLYKYILVHGLTKKKRKVRLTHIYSINLGVLNIEVFLPLSGG